MRSDLDRLETQLEKSQESVDWYRLVEEINTMADWCTQQANGVHDLVTSGNTGTNPVELNKQRYTHEVGSFASYMGALVI